MTATRDQQGTQGMQGTATQGTKRPITIEDLAAIKLISDPQISPDGTRVAYVVTVMDTEEDGYRSQVWVVPTAGGEPLRYTGGRNDSSPRWSPDGSKLVFVSKRGDGTKEGEKKAKPQLWLLDTGGGEARQLTKVKDGASDPVWSPDGARLAFTERAFETLVDGDLWVMDAMTGEVTNLDDDAFSGDLPVDDAPHDAPVSVPVTPAFAPDGGTVAFSRSLVVDGAWAGNEIAVVPVEGGTPRRLVRVTDQEPGVVYYGMRWAPDGDRLFYAVHDPDRANPDNGIWVVDADGRNARHVLGMTDPDLGPPSIAEVSPRGDALLAFYPIGAMRFSSIGIDAYALVDAASGAVDPVTLQGPDVPERAFVALATFSPDGSKLLYTARLPGPDNQVLVRDIEGGEEVRLAEGLPGVIGVAFGIGPTWATNGTIFIPAGGTLSTGTLLVVD